jgi:uncharacterized membrane protein
MHGHLKRHRRFYLALLLGALAGVAGGQMLPIPGLAQPPLAGSVFFAVYLLSTFVSCLKLRPDDLRRAADVADEGLPLILLITVAAVALSIAAIFALLNHKADRDTLPIVVSLLSVPLGWMTLHTVAALHYAHLYYGAAPGHDRRKRADAGGLDFPGTKEPDTWDFLYYSFVVGMTAQVSDVQVTAPAMRRLTLSHGVVSFFFKKRLFGNGVKIVVSQPPSITA